MVFDIKNPTESYVCLKLSLASLEVFLKAHEDGFGFLNSYFIETCVNTIGQVEISHALLDLGASINLLPFSIYQQLEFGDLSTTRVTI